jgi:predicted AAA+ superfamily ATPase
MKNQLTQLIDDFQERELPQPVPRENSLFEISGKADVVIGMRRSGKTWFCFQKINALLIAGIPKTQILYLNFEDDRLLEFDTNHFQLILDIYYAKHPRHRDTGAYFFLDEIQRIDNWEMFIRRLLDTEKVQIYLTGSSSKLLSTDIATSLRGRSLTVEIFPLSFSEFLNFHELIHNNPKTFGSKTVSTLRKAAKDYLEIGGFPEVQLLEQHLRTEILQGYVDSVLLKDIIERYKVGNVLALKHLVRSVMAAPGGKFSVNKFYNTLRSMAVKCTKNNLYAYLDYLVDSFLFFKVPLHTRSEKAKLVNPVKMYTIDTGLLNAMTFRNALNYGALLENMVFMHLRRIGYDVEYVTTKDGYETDFFARRKSDGKILLIQSCWDISKKTTFEREVRGLKSAMTEFNIDTGTIVTWDDEIELDSTINVVPIWKWLIVKSPEN